MTNGNDDNGFTNFNKHNYKIINVAGNRKAVKSPISKIKGSQKKTISLTCEYSLY